MCAIRFVTQLKVSQVYCFETQIIQKIFIIIFDGLEDNLIIYSSSLALSYSNSPISISFIYKLNIQSLIQNNGDLDQQKLIESMKAEYRLNCNKMNENFISMEYMNIDVYFISLQFCFVYSSMLQFYFNKIQHMVPIYYKLLCVRKHNSILPREDNN